MRQLSVKSHSGITQWNYCNCQQIPELIPKLTNIAAHDCPRLVPQIDVVRSTKLCPRSSGRKPMDWAKARVQEVKSGPKLTPGSVASVVSHGAKKAQKEPICQHHCHCHSACDSDQKYQNWFSPSSWVRARNSTNLAFGGSNWLIGPPAVLWTIRRFLSQSWAEVIL